MSENKDIGNKIRKARQEKGLTAKQVGAALGYTEKNGEVYVSNWETGKRPVPTKKIRKLARLLDMNIEEFVI